MKIKAIKPIPSYGSFMGFSIEDWNNLNAGLVVDVDSIPKKGKEYVEKFKEPKKVKKEKGK